MHTVFINDKPFRFVNVYEAEEWKGSTQSIFIAEEDMSVEEAMTELEESDSHPGFIYLSSNPNGTWQLFNSYCTLIEASGGLVMNEKNEYLVIFRKGKYDLPKGKMEYDESPEQAGIREVEEECGITDLEIISTLEKTFHTYTLKKKRILKKTNWYLMRTTSQELIPQTEEDIEKAEWLTHQQIKDIALKNTYASIEELIEESLI
ncbi:NUDIX domain-containing protein [soil metagenome]